MSIDVALFRDGSQDRSQIEMLKAVRKKLDEGESGVSIPPGDLAYRKQSKLLNLDGSHELVVNGTTHFPRLGVDGKLDTTALAANEWPWTYEVDLVDVKAGSTREDHIWPGRIRSTVRDSTRMWSCRRRR